MSTKIYEAYKMNDVCLLSDFLIDYHEWSWKQLIKYVKAQTINSNPDKCATLLGIEETNWWKVNKENKDIRELVSSGAAIAMNMYESSGDLGRLWSFDVSLNLWIHNGAVYIIPYHPNKFPQFDSIIKEYELLDFAYWNNVDIPDKISTDEWESRGKEWVMVCLNDWNKKRLSHIVYEGLASNIESLNEICEKLENGRMEHLSSVVQDAFFKLKKDRESKRWNG